MISKVFAICLLVENLARSRNFYEDQMGMIVNSTDEGFVDYKLGDTPLALFEKSHATAMFDKKYMTPAGGAVIALQVDDVIKTCKELTDKGVVIFEHPKQTSWGQNVAYLHDPDGHIFELTS